MVIENLDAKILLKFLDRDFAREAVIGAIEVGEDGLHNCLLPLEDHDIARIAISVGIARDVGDGLAGLAIRWRRARSQRRPSRHRQAEVLAVHRNEHGLRGNAG
jgi:hypothetical protein